MKAPDCKPYLDFEELLERDDIDAVHITTPDHWHALITAMALDAGKHVYVEKPMSHDIAEGRILPVPRHLRDSWSQTEQPELR